MLSTRDSHAFNLLRFPLIVAVVFIHDSIPVDYPSMNLFSAFVGVVTSAAVPIFFLMSGCLFFKDMDEFSFKTYGGKLKKRVWSLLVPYLIWNLVTIIYLLCGELFFSGMVSGANKAVSSYGVLDWLRAFWDGRSGFPVCYQMWFIRDLMVLCVLSPIIWFLLYKGGLSLPILAGIFCLGGFKTGVTGLSEIAFFYFTLGGWYGMSKRSMTEDTFKIAYPALFVWLALVGFYCAYCETDCRAVSVFYRTAGFLGTCVAMSFAGRSADKGSRANKFLLGSTFFVFASHALLLSPIIKVVTKYLAPTSGKIAICEYLASPMLTIGVCLGIYAVLHLVMPKVTAFASGGRN